MTDEHTIDLAYAWDDKRKDRTEALDIEADIDTLRTKLLSMGATKEELLGEDPLAALDRLIQALKASNEEREGEYPREGPCRRCGGTGRLIQREGGYVPCPVCSVEPERSDEGTEK